MRSTPPQGARRLLAERLRNLRGQMSRERAGRLLGERLDRAPFSAARIGNFEQANYWKSLPTERHLRALAHVYAPEHAQRIGDELAALLGSVLADDAMGFGSAGPPPHRALILVPPFGDDETDERETEGFRELLVSRLSTLPGVAARAVGQDPLKGGTAPGGASTYVLWATSTARPEGPGLFATLGIVGDPVPSWSDRHPLSAAGLEAMSNGVAGALGLTVAPEPPGAHAGQSFDRRAYRLCLRAIGLLGSNAEPELVTALALLRRALRLEPGLAEAHAWLAYGLWRRYFAGWDSSSATLRLALQHAASALELDERCEAARMALIRIYWDLGLHERGIAEGLTALQDRPGSTDAALSLARAFNNAGLADVALPMTQEVLQTDPSNPAARKLLVWNHLMVGDAEEALAVARNLWPSGAPDSNTTWAVTVALWRLGHVGEAVRAAATALAKDDINFTLWVLLGYVHRAGGDEPAAQTAWRQGLAILERRTPSPTNHRATAWIANLVAATGAHERAATMCAEIRRAEPTNGYVAYRLAHVAAELGDPGDSLVLLTGAVEAGFLSVQLMRHEEGCGLGPLVAHPGYRRVVSDLERRVIDVRDKYVPLLETLETSIRPIDRDGTRGSSPPW